MVFPSSSSTGETSLPPWFGFAVGAMAGFTLSAGFIGLVLGYSLGGGSTGAARAPIAAQPTAPTPPPPPGEAAPAANVPAVGKGDHVRGDPDAPITVIEYSDFECPFCKRHHPTLVQLMDVYKGKVNWVYRHFPLSFHANAQKEAEASECVASLNGNDAFWKFTDLLVERTQAGGNGFALDKLPALAKEVGVNEGKFKECLDGGKMEQVVKDQMNEGVNAGVQGTPANFIVDNVNKVTKEVSGAVPLTSFQATIDAMLK